MNRRSLSGRAGLWLPPVILMAGIFSLSAQSNPIPVVTTHVWDKLLHTLEYGSLAVLFARALTGEGVAALRAIVLAVLLTSAYGATDEYHQRFVPMRSADVMDWVADTIGSSLGAVAYVEVRRRRG